MTIAAVIAHSSYVVTSGLHSLVTAVAYGKPCCAVPSGGTKILGFLEEIGLSDIMTPTWEILPSRIQDLGNVSEMRIRDAAEAGRERLDRHFDALQHLITSPASRSH